MSAIFTAIIVTAAPPGLAAEGSGIMAKVDGREVILRSVELFLSRDNVKQVLLVITPEAEEEIKRKYGGSLGFLGVKVVIGGKKWNEQIVAAAARVDAESTHVLIHDAARPVTAVSDIDAIIEAADKNPAVMLATPLKTGLIELDEGGGPVATHTPSSYMQILSPQALNRSRLTALVAGKEIHPSEWTIVRGSPLNVRVTSGADASLAGAMLKLLPKPKIKAPSNPFEEAQW